MIKRLLESLDNGTEIVFTKLSDRYYVKVVKWIKDIPYSKKVLVPKEDLGFIDIIMKEELGIEILGEEE